MLHPLRVGAGDQPERGVDLRAACDLADLAAGLAEALPQPRGMRSQSVLTWVTCSSATRQASSRWWGNRKGRSIGARGRTSVAVTLSSTSVRRDRVVHHGGRIAHAYEPRSTGRRLMLVVCVRVRDRRASVARGS